MTKSRKVVGHTILYSIGEIVPRVFSLLLLPILTHYLSPSDYGINSFTTTFMTFLFVLASLSLNTFVLKNYYSEPNEAERKKIVGGIFLFICLFNILIFIAQIAILPAAIAYFDLKIPFYPFFFLAALNNFFEVVTIIPLALYRVKENVKGFLFLSLSRIILQYGLTYYLIVHVGMGLLGSYLGKLYINIPFLFIYIYVIYRGASFVIEWDLIKRALKFSLPLLPASISFLAISISDRIILGYYLPLHSLGVYSLAFTLALTLNIVIQALYKTFEQIIFKSYSAEGFPDLNLKLLKVYSLCLSAGGLAVALFSREIFLIAASRQFFEGNSLVPFMLVSVIISGMNSYLSTVLIAGNQQKLVSSFTFLGALLSVGFNFILIPKMGYNGAIVSSSLAVLFIFIACSLKLKIKMQIVYYQVASLSIIVFIPSFINSNMADQGLIINVLFKLIVVSCFLFLSANLFNFSLVKEIKTLLKRN